jgi:fibronectin type 3 domain-containing protein
MASMMTQVLEIVSAAAITICPIVIHSTIAIPSLSGLGQEVKQPAHLQNSDAKPKAHSVNLNWKASTSTVVGYNVYRAEKSDGPFTKLNSSPIVKTNYEDTGVRGGHTYYYKVAAVDAKGKESESTAQIQAVVPSP